MASPPILDWQLDEDRFVSLLEKLINEARYLQNNPPECVPKEDRAVRHVLDVLQPYSEEEGGPLHIQHVSYVEGRGNLIITYKGSHPSNVLSFVGCHMDVVTANPDDWDFDPFTFSRDGDKLRGRGTTDCLGHVALVTELMRQLAVCRPELDATVVAVLIANEENATVKDIGVDGLVKAGLLDHLRNGPLFWVDTADKQPCIGTGGMLAWKLKAFGKLFHSGLPHKAINPIELAMTALAEMQTRFYRDFPPHAMEKTYGFATPSTMKPTQWSCETHLPAPNSLLALPFLPWAFVWSTRAPTLQLPIPCSLAPYDIRITPFYDVDEVAAKLREYVADINANLNTLSGPGPCSKFVLPEENLQGRLELEIAEAPMKGVACNLDSPGYHALVTATKEVMGECKPYSITGSLPLIRDLQEAGFDVQTMGYGVMATYHARNEYALLSDFKLGYRVLTNLIHNLS
ncbi:unnamed protein product [Closterium sp. NIES-53]